LVKPDGASILIIDEDIDNRTLLKESFAHTSVKILNFDNFKDAVVMLKKEKVDLILIDIDMLTIDDCAVSKVLKTVTKAPVVTLTDKRLSDITFASNGIMPVGHLKKPLSKIELFKITLKILNSKNIFIDESGRVEIDSKNKNKPLNNIDIEELEKFLYAQNSDLQKMYKEAVATNDLNIIKTFSKLLLELSLKYKIKSMSEYSKLLLSKIEEFEIEDINIMLNDYKDKILKFESIIKK
jgi:polar amino acid transport system substrate-binding protein/two-component system sensor histidine kinase EvgS